ncbi:hypothetical protein B0H13DRAFT_1950446 [Mycena leptocephala]|nr:hypothetical protein B0H13DRAFT_1950446 [Mycena leptocephala]
MSYPNRALGGSGPTYIYRVAGAICLCLLPLPTPLAACYPDPTNSPARVRIALTRSSGELIVIVCYVISNNGCCLRWESDYHPTARRQHQQHSRIIQTVTARN